MEKMKATIKEILTQIVIFPVWLTIVYLPEKMYEGTKNILKKYYEILEKFDPPPELHEQEDIQEWLKKVDLKYALRKVKYMKLNDCEIDYQEHEEFIKGLKRKKDIKDMQLLARVASKLNSFHDECYRMVMARQEIEKQLREQ